MSRFGKRRPRRRGLPDLGGFLRRGSGWRLLREARPESLASADRDRNAHALESFTRTALASESHYRDADRAGRGVPRGRRGREIRGRRGPGGRNGRSDRLPGYRLVGPVGRMGGAPVRAPVPDRGHSRRLRGQAGPGRRARVPDPQQRATVHQHPSVAAGGRRYERRAPGRELVGDGAPGTPCSRGAPTPREDRQHAAVPAVGGSSGRPGTESWSWPG